MKLLLDECLPHDLRHHLPGHDARTVGYMRWNGIKNGRLLRLAAADGFDALIKTDAGIPHQHNPATLPLAIVVLDSNSNAIPDLLNVVPDLLRILSSLQPCSIVYVP